MSLENIGYSPAGRAVASFLLGACLVGAAYGTATAITEGSYKYADEQTGYLTISSSALIPDSNGTVYHNAWNNGLSTTEGGCFTTGLNFPHASTLKEIEVRVSRRNNEPSYFSILTNDLLRTDIRLIISKQINDNTGNPVSLTYPIDSVRVSNKSRTYLLGVCIGKGNVFYGVRITYGYSTAGD